MTHTSSSETDQAAQPQKPDYRKQIEGWCAEWYEASVLVRGKPSDTIHRFKTIASIQPQLRDAAVSLLNEIQDIPAERCFITKTKVEFLRKVTT